MLAAVYARFACPYAFCAVVCAVLAAAYARFAWLYAAVESPPPPPAAANIAIFALPLPESVTVIVTLAVFTKFNCFEDNVDPLFCETLTVLADVLAAPYAFCAVVWAALAWSYAGPGLLAYAPLAAAYANSAILYELFALLAATSAVFAELFAMFAATFAVLSAKTLIFNTVLTASLAFLTEFAVAA